MKTLTRQIELRQGVLGKNDQLAAGLRARFASAGVFVINVVSSPGSGKTALLEVLMRQMRARGLRVAALVGDLETDNDAKRLARSGAPVRQIVTHGDCHLEASMIEAHLAAAGWDLAQLDVLFIENVGNLVCPSSYDLGENLRMVLLSVTEGEDKPLKYPVMFNSAGLAVITKLDLAEACECDLAEMRRNITSVHPGMMIVAVSAKSGDGIGSLLDLLVDIRTQR